MYLDLRGVCGTRAGVVELVDTLALGASGRKPLGVRVPSPASPAPARADFSSARRGRSGLAPRYGLLASVWRWMYQAASIGLRKCGGSSACRRLSYLRLYGYPLMADVPLNTPVIPL